MLELGPGILGGELSVNADLVGIVPLGPGGRLAAECAHHTSPSVRKTMANIARRLQENRTSGPVHSGGLGIGYPPDAAQLQRGRIGMPTRRGLVLWMSAVADLKPEAGAAAKSRQAVSE